MLHGHFSEIYVRHDRELTSPPALEFVLMPVLGLGQLVGLAPHLRVGGEPLSLWFIVGPVAVLLGSTVLFSPSTSGRTLVAAR